MPHRINSLICLTLVLCFWTQFAQAQSSIPRPASGTRSAPKKPSVPAAGQKTPATSVPRIAREPVGNATLADEPAENAEPQRKPAGPFPKQGAMQGPDPQQPAGEGPAPQVVFEPVSKEMETLLRKWEAKTKNITSLSCPITRSEFDNIFATETRSSGMIYFENPDLGRIDFEPADEKRMAMPAGRQKQDGQAFKLLPGTSTKWICTGKLIYILEMSPKTYDKIQIPPQMQGQNITRSPLPFIFGMKAQDAMDRFALRFGDFHNPDGDQVDKNGKPLRQVLHIVANPFDPNVAREYTQAEIILDPETFMPLNLRTIDPTQNKQTVYGFDNAKLKVGVNWGLKSPFRDPVLVGWEIMHDIKAEPEKPPVRQAQRNGK